MGMFKTKFREYLRELALKSPDTTITKEKILMRGIC